MTYYELDRKYQRISNENTLRARRKDTPEAYARARSREKLILKVFLMTVNDI